MGGFIFVSGGEARLEFSSRFFADINAMDGEESLQFLAITDFEFFRLMSASCEIMVGA